MIRYSLEAPRHATPRMPTHVASLAFAAACAYGSTCAFSAQPQVVFFDEARTTGPEVRLGDVANVSSLPGEWQEKAARLVVANAPDCGEPSTFSVALLARSARLQMPGISPWLEADGLTSRAVVVVVGREAGIAAQRASATTRVRPASCMQMAQPVPAGVAIGPGDIDLSYVPCASGTAQRVAYSLDTHVVRAAKPLAPGDLIVALPLATLARSRRGEPVTSNVSEGRVTVSRTSAAPRDQAIGRRPFVQAPISLPEPS